MNNRDIFIQLQASPAEKWTAVASVHSLALDEANDVLYSGGGANRAHSQFGFAGTALNGSRSLGTLSDLQVTYQVEKNLSLSGYAGHVERGEALLSSSTSGSLNFAFLELNASF